jgi:hypothetical protein
MIGRDRQALLLGLDQYAPDALDSEKVLDRVSGSVKGLWLKLSIDTQEDSELDEANPCAVAPPSQPPSSVQCFFKAEEPLKGMQVQDADGNWHLIDIPVDAGGRWGTAFKGAHLDDWTGLPDIDGNEQTGFFFQDWDMEGGEVFATKEFTGPIEISEGHAIETTYLEIRHTPQPSTAP